MNDHESNHSYNICLRMVARTSRPAWLGVFFAFACSSPHAPREGSGGAGGSDAPSTAGTSGNGASGFPSTPTAGANANESGASSTGGGVTGGMSSSAGAGGAAPGGAPGGGAPNTAGTTGAGGTAGSASNAALEKFSFFVTSLASIRKVSKSDEGFGGDLRFGETGDGAGLRGADKICKAVAELGMPGAGAKEWRAFLSTTAGGPNGEPVHARSRVGKGPWYDAAGRLVAMTLEDLTTGNRPVGADPAIRDDLPNEFGIPNHSADAPGCTGNQCPDNHQILTGTNCIGELYTGGGTGTGQNEVTADCTNVKPSANEPDPAYTCNDWTSKEAAGKPWCGHSWPRRGSGLSWMSAARDGGCAPCVKIEEGGGVSSACVGSAGGYGGFYCLEYKP